MMLLLIRMYFYVHVCVHYTCTYVKAGRKLVLSLRKELPTL